MKISINSFKNLSYVAFGDYETSEIKKRKNESKIITIDIIDESFGPYFVVIYDYTILFLKNISLLPQLINNFDASTIFIMSLDIKSHFPNEFPSKIYEYEKYDYKVYLTTIKSFSKNFIIKYTEYPEVCKIWKLVLPSFSSYFINKSY